MPTSAAPARPARCTNGSARSAAPAGRGAARRGLADLHLILCQQLAGDNDAALAGASDFAERSRREEEPTVADLGVMMLGRCHLLRGSVRSARLHLLEAVESVRTHGVGDALSWALALLCQAEVLTGDLGAAKRAQQESRAVQGPFPVARCQPDLLLADAHIQLARGDATGAARACVDGAQELPHLHVHRARLLHLAARAGGPLAPIDDALRQIPAWVESPLPRLRADHVHALRTGDGPAQVTAARRFERMGMWLVAAEVLAGAAATYQQRGNKSAASRVAAESARLTDRCEGAQSPLLAVPAGPSTVLSRREREVARLAADGRSNNEIADELTVSVRTVESHLYQAFGKLGVANRPGLDSAVLDH